MSIFEITSNVEFYFNEIEQVLKRLNYPLNKESCTNVVLENGKFVGAYNLSSSAPLGAKGCRIIWLAVTKESEERNLHTGSHIIASVINSAKSEALESVYVSVNIKNERAISLYTRFGFLVVNTVDSEQDMKLCIL